MAEISPLRRRMIEDMTVRNLSPATQRSYIHAVSKFSRYFGRSPDRLGLEDVRAFQVHLVSTGISWASLNQIVCALRFFYGVTLGCDTIPERIAYAREPRKLPVRAERRRSGPISRSRLEPQSARRADHGLCRGTARVGGDRPEGRPTSTATAWSSGSSAARAARSATSCCPSNCSASCAAIGVSRGPRRFLVSRSRQGQADRANRPARRLPFGARGGRHRQARERPCPAAQLRDASAGERRRHSHHPGAARPRASVDDGALHAGLDASDQRRRRARWTGFPWR